MRESFCKWDGGGGGGGEEKGEDGDETQISKM